MIKIGNRQLLIAIAALEACCLAWLIGLGAAYLWLSQPSAAYLEVMYPTVEFSSVADTPLLTQTQKDFARQRGYIPVWIGDQHYFLINPPEEYL